VIYILFNFYIIIRRSKKIWHNRYIPPGYERKPFYSENREGIPMSSQRTEYNIGSFLCGFLVLWVKFNGARAPPL